MKDLNVVMMSLDLKYLNFSGAINDFEVDGLVQTKFS